VNAPASLDDLVATAYEELRAIAHARLAWRGAGGTLSTTALVHEAYLKLADQSPSKWRDRAHFFAVASLAMRHVLVDFAKARVTLKRGGARRRITLDDDAIFDYPWIILQQPGMGRWHPRGEQAARLREYFRRGGFMMVDDFHGEYEWASFQDAMEEVLPDRSIVDIPDGDPLFGIVFELDKKIQIPGDRHVRYGGGMRMEGPPHWRGIYDEKGRLIVAIGHNSDMGDGWEHADDPGYPTDKTAMAYRFGVNYVIYSMTH